MLQTTDIDLIYLIKLLDKNQIKTIQIAVLDIYIVSTKEWNLYYILNIRQ
jgi:hypothetical protein